MLADTNRLGGRAGDAVAVRQARGGLHSGWYRFRRRPAMRIGRIVQLLVLIGAIVFILIVQGANPAPLALPALLPLPIWIVLLGTALVAFLAGWLPASVRAWRLRREVQRLERRVAELESHVPSYDRSHEAVVIPDRAFPRVGDGNGPDS